MGKYRMGRKEGQFMEEEKKNETKIIIIKKLVLERSGSGLEWILSWKR